MSTSMKRDEAWHTAYSERSTRWSAKPEQSQAAGLDNVEFVELGMGTITMAKPPTRPAKALSVQRQWELREFTLTLPYPPTLNHNTQPALGGGRYLTDEHRNFRALVAQIVFCAGIKRLDGKLSVAITVYPPDARKRDLSNLIKPIEDALQRAGAILDDANVDSISVLRVISEPRAARVIVSVRELA